MKNLYDIVIFLPLKVEDVIVSSRTRGAAEVEVDRTPTTA